MSTATCLYRALLGAGLLLLGGGVAAQGEVIVVNDSPDYADFAGARRVADLPGPDGRVTFREAIIAANNTPGPQTIHFNIPQSRWWSLFTDRATVFADYDAFIITDDSTTIDGRSQTAFTGDTNPSGNEVCFWGEHPNSLGIPMIILNSDGNVIVGLDQMQRRGYGISISAGSDGNHIFGNTISAPLYAAVRIQGSGNTVGGTQPGEGNRLSSGNDGVRVESGFQSPPPSGNRIVGNVLTGSAAGVQVRAGAVGTVVGGPTPAERNIIAGAGHYGEEGFPVGDQVLIWDAVGTIVEGNYIGTDASGNVAAYQVGPSGINVRNSSGTVIRDNVIGGIRIEGRNHYMGQWFGWAIEIEGASAGTIIEGNSIGVGADGQSVVANLNGIRAGFWPGSGTPTATRIGGTQLAPGSGNVIAHNERDGVAVDAQTSGVSILGNAVFNNGQEGIDLSPAGPTTNDPLDVDEGANRLQNHPAIADATLNGNLLSVTYSVDSTPSSSTFPLRVEFFLADADAQEGAVFLGSDVYTAPGTRDVVLDVTGSGTIPGSTLLATATDAVGNTSEFGAPRDVAAGTGTAGEPRPDLLAEGFLLSPAVPNPAVDHARFTLELAESQRVSIQVVDLLGRRMLTVLDDVLPAGLVHEFVLGVSRLPAGSYAIVVTGEAFAATRRATVAR